MPKKMLEYNYDGKWVSFKPLYLPRSEHLIIKQTERNVTDCELEKLLKQKFVYGCFQSQQTQTVPTTQLRIVNI